MPLHDWGDTSGWEGVHLLWMAELLRFAKGRLPAGFRAYLGSGPAVAIGAPAAHLDVAVRSHPDPAVHASSAITRPADESSEPDVEVAVALLEPAPSLFIERDHRLVA